MTGKPPRGGLATHDELVTLHRLLLDSLTERLKRDRVGIEQLAVARSFLADNGFRGAWAMNHRTQKRLEKLYAALCVKFAEALASPEQKDAGVLRECRGFLKSQGIDKDFAAVLDKGTAGAAVELLAGVELPFKPRE